MNVVGALRVRNHASELLLALVSRENENAEKNNSKEADPGMFFTQDHARI